MDLLNIITFIKENYPYRAGEINECLELLIDSLESTITELQESSTSEFSRKNFDRIKTLVDAATDISELQNEIRKYMDYLEIDQEFDNCNDDEAANKLIPNYSDYVVDSNIPHTLYENFTHIRPAGFSIQESKKIDASTWQEVLLLTCEILYKKDSSKFERFLSDPTMNGKKNQYFSKVPEGMRKPEMILNIGIYIESNMNANMVRNLIVKMLRKFGLSISDYTVYFKADYTTLHE